MSKALKIASGLALSASVAAYACSKSALLKSNDGEEKHEQVNQQNPQSFPVPLGKVLASWTTNFEPIIEWNKNWDR